MNSMKFEACFTYDVEGIPEIIKNFAEHQFINARNKAIEELNPHYDEWNNAYDQEITGCDDMRYNAYIRRKQNRILMEFNKRWFGPVKLYSDEYADIIGKFNVFGKIVTMKMSLKPVD